MKTIALILLGLLTAWWGVLTLWVVSCHRERARAAAKPMTPEEVEDCRALEARIPRRYMHAKDWAAATPFLLPVMLMMLPLYVYGWLIREPHRKP